MYQLIALYSFGLDPVSSKQTAQIIKAKKKTIFHNIYKIIVNLTTVRIFDIEELFFKI